MLIIKKLDDRGCMTSSGGHGVSRMQCSSQIHENSVYKQVTISCVAVSSMSRSNWTVSDRKSVHSNLVQMWDYRQLVMKKRRVRSLITRALLIALKTSDCSISSVHSSSPSMMIRSCCIDFHSQAVRARGWMIRCRSCEFISFLKIAESSVIVFVMNSFLPGTRTMI